MFELVTWPRSPWSIFDELDSLQRDVDRILSGRESSERDRTDRSWRRRPTYPLMNVWSGADGIVIDAEIPGLDLNDVDVSVVRDELSLVGKVNAVAELEGDTFHRRERPTGDFSRTLKLPFRADAAGVKASYKNGVLRVTVPRSEEEKPKKIAIEAS